MSRTGHFQMSGGTCPIMLAGTASHPRRRNPRRRHLAQPTPRTRPHAPGHLRHRRRPRRATLRPHRQPEDHPRRTRPARTPQVPRLHTRHRRRHRRLTNPPGSLALCSNTTQIDSSHVCAGQHQNSAIRVPTICGSQARGPSRPVNGSTVCAFDPAANLTTRLVPSSTYTLPAASTATSRGLSRSVNGNTVWVSDRAANFTTRLPSSTYTLPAASTATPCGFLRSVNGNTVWALDPAANLTTRRLPLSAMYTLPPVSTAIPSG